MNKRVFTKIPRIEELYSLFYIDPIAFSIGFSVYGIIFLLGLRNLFKKMEENDALINSLEPNTNNVALKSDMLINNISLQSYVDIIYGIPISY
jgi:hypothetical protein